MATLRLFSLLICCLYLDISFVNPLRLKNLLTRHIGVIYCATSFKAIRSFLVASFSSPSVLMSVCSKGGRLFSYSIRIAASISSYLNRSSSSIASGFRIPNLVPIRTWLEK